MKPLQLVAVSAGLRNPSSTRLLADRLLAATTQHLAEQRPVEVRVVELRDLATEVANHLAAGFPGPALRAVIETVTGADALIAVTPIFTASYSGLFKSFFDLLDDTALTAKPVLIAATGGSARHSLALEHAMRPMFAYLRAQVVPTAVYAASEDWGHGAHAHTGSLAERITRAAQQLAELTLLRSTAAERPETVMPFERQLAALRPRPAPLAG